MAYLKPGETPPKVGRGSRLTPKMLRFIEEYMADPKMNGSQAVLRAGYKTRNANRIATDLMRHPLVKKEIENRLAERRERMSLTSDYVLAKLQEIVDKTEESNPAVAVRSLELLGKHLGLYRDRQEISGPDGKAIEMEQKTKEDVSDFTSRLQRLREAAESKEDTVIPFRKVANGSE